MQILEIIVGARRPLTVREMALALGTALATKATHLADVKIDAFHIQRPIRLWCGLFVFINNHRIYLIHQTAKEFLPRVSGNKTLIHFRWKQSLGVLNVELEYGRYFCQVPLARRFGCGGNIWCSRTADRVLLKKK